MIFNVPFEQIKEETSINLLSKKVVFNMDKNQILIL